MFSVIIPVYNGASFVEKAIESVFAQTCAQWELIVVNDGSSDDTAAVLKKYEHQKNVKIISQKNAGVSVARNTGMEHARFPYLTFLDADDVWYENHLAVLKEMIETYPNAGMYGTFTETQFADGTCQKESSFFRDKPKILYLEDFFSAYDQDKAAKMYSMISTCVTKKAAETAGGFPVGCKIGEDLGFTLTIAAYYPVVLTGRATALYQKANSNATKDVSFDPDWYFFKEVEAIYQSAEISEDKKAHIKSVMQWFTMRQSRHYSIEGRKKEAFCAYKRIGTSKNLRRDKLITALLLIIPTKLIRFLFRIRWRHQV